jgi:hypothetical protein
MTQLPFMPDSEETEQTPLPLIVAQRWNFPLAHVQTENGIVYAIQDWMRGLSGEEDVRQLWNVFKKTEAGNQLYVCPIKRAMEKLASALILTTIPNDT